MTNKPRRKRSKALYREGTCFFVPLHKVVRFEGRWIRSVDPDTGRAQKDGFCRGVVARRNRGRSKFFGYFFGPKLSRAEGSFADLKAQDSVLLSHCTPVGLENGEWPLAGELEGWSRDKWPYPPGYREIKDWRRAFLTYYDENTLEALYEVPTEFVGYEEETQRQVAFYGSIRKEPVIKIGGTKYPYDRLAGHGAVEIRMTWNLFEEES